MLDQSSSPDFTKLSDSQLQVASWYVTNKPLLKKILIGVLIFIDVLSWGYVFYGLANYYFIEEPRFSAATLELTNFNNYTAIKEKSAPRNLSIGATSIFPINGGRYDLVANIKNDNPKWYIEFDYNFIVDGEPLPVKSGFILPGEEKYLLNLGQEFKTKPRQARVEISNFKWRKINAHEIPDYDRWRDEHLNIALEEVKFLPAIIRDKLIISRASFIAKNLTAYSFWDAGLYILLYRGSALASVNYISLNEFISGQKRSVQVSWFEPLSSVTQVKVIPEINIFDKKAYMPVE
jgi:hypothetical protein